MTEDGNMAQIREKIITAIERHRLIGKGDHVVVGLSGGPDSLCLFHVLLGLREEYCMTVEAVHVNHGLRPGAAEADQAFVEEFCRREGVRCTTFCYDCNAVAAELGMTSEEAGRKLRYEAFDRVAERAASERRSERGKVRIAVAQNANDQAETILFRLARGTGTDGLAGIEYSRKSEKGFDIIRPLLDIARPEIEKYCGENSLDPCIDKTNAEAIYTRNKIRLELLPYIQKNLNPDILQSLLRLSRTAQEDKSYIWQQAQEAYASALLCRGSDFVEAELTALQNMPPSIRHRVLSAAFADVGLAKDIGRAHLEAADSLIEKGASGTSASFPQGYRLWINYGAVRIGRMAPEAQDEAQNATNSSLQIGDIIVKSTFSDNGVYEVTLQNGKGKTLRVTLDAEGFSAHKGQPDVALRYRQNGDYIAIARGGGAAAVGTKKLQDFFVDQKIAREQRGRIPLLCAGREVLVILGDEFTGLDTGFVKSRFTAAYRQS